MGEITKTHSFKQYISESFAQGKYAVIQQGENPIAGYADGNPFENYKDVTLFGDHTLSLFKPQGKFFVASDGIKILSPSLKMSGMFYYYLLEKYKPQSEGYKRHFTIMKKSTALFPIEIDEQVKISKFLKEFDFLITLHQRKIDKLKNLKKAMLEKMFPKKGSVIPEIRFNGFANAWEQQKLGEVFETVTDYVAAGSFADLAENVVYRDTPNYAQLVRTTDLKNGFHSGSNVYVDKKAFDFLYRVNLDKECIILPNIGNCGEVYLVIPDNLPYKHNVLGPNAILIRSDTSDNVFLSILLQGKDFQEKLSLIISPNGQTKFNKTELKQISLNMPKQSDEQHQLGAYFSQLDRLITLHQRKLDMLKKLKSACLSEMFI